MSESIRALRKRVEGAKERVSEHRQAAAGRKEQMRLTLELKKSRLRESGPVQEAKAAGRELGKVGGPVVQASRSVVEAARSATQRVSDAEGSLREKAARLDGTLEEVQAAEADALGMVDEAFDMDLEVVDDLKRGESGVGVGDADGDFDVDLDVVGGAFEEDGGLGDIEADLLGDQR